MSASYMFSADSLTKKPTGCNFHIPSLYFTTAAKTPQARTDIVTSFSLTFDNDNSPLDFTLLIALYEVKEFSRSSSSQDPDDREGTLSSSSIDNSMTFW
mmetsp:Transcript_12866/g.24348  ORF Transcript_12866/g.24348 Transcript_12866/m.24348 type:complete len:99 (-) Transcript_12866:1732-2028(-)